LGYLKAAELAPVSVRIVLAEEIDPPENEEPFSRMMLTSLVADLRGMETALSS